MVPYLYCIGISYKKISPGMELPDCYTQGKDHSPGNSHQTLQILTTS